MFARFTALVLAALLALPALAQPEEPGVLVERVSKEVLGVLQQNAGNIDKQQSMALVREKVLPHFDFTRMTALATGLGWRSATPEQQGELVKQFQTLLVRTYSTALTRYTNQSLEFEAARYDESKKKALVRSLLRQPGAPVLTIDYKMAQGTDQWKIYDVTVDGISLVTTYRDSFAEEVRTNGIDGLIKMLVSKNNSLAGQGTS